MYNLLHSLVCLEKDVDDEYIDKRMDLTTMIRNTGGDGGMRLLRE